MSYKQIDQIDCRVGTLQGGGNIQSISKKGKKKKEKEKEKKTKSIKIAYSRVESRPERL